MTGTIVSWFEPRAYGFIRPDSPIAGGPVEIFAHISDMPNRQPLPKDTRVSFELGIFGGRTKAINIVAVRQ